VEEAVTGIIVAAMIEEKEIEIVIRIGIGTGIEMMIMTATMVMMVVTAAATEELGVELASDLQSRVTSAEQRTRLCPRKRKLMNCGQCARLIRASLISLGLRYRASSAGT